MKRREITIVTDEDNVSRVKGILQDIRASNPSLFFSHPIEGAIGEMVLLTIKVMLESFEPFLEIILKRRLKLFTKEEKAKVEAKLNENKNQEQDSYKYIDSFVNIEPPSPTEMFSKNLEDYIKEGNYRAIIIIYKDVKEQHSIKIKAKKVLPVVLEEIIQLLYSRAISRGNFAEEGINKLIKIGQDKVLANEGYQKFMRYSIYNAIELCGIYHENLYKLIGIANNAQMPKEACIKAAAKFGKVTLADQVKFKSDLADAVRNLNYRWLQTIFEITSNALKNDEIANYEKLKRHIIHLRK